MRRFLGRLLLAWATVAGALALTDDIPSDLPAWALEHESVYRGLVWLVLFAVGAFLVNVLALVFHGWLFTGVGAGPAQADAQKVASEAQEGAVQDVISALEKLAEGADQIVTDLHDRTAALESHAGITPPQTPPESLATLLQKE